MQIDNVHTQGKNPSKPPTKRAGVKVLKCIMPKVRSAFLTDLSPMAQSSPSLSAPVRYLHSLVRRLLYSHLTPSTLSSPTALSTPILTPSSHCSMGDSVWCYDQCMSAALSSPGHQQGGLSTPAGGGRAQCSGVFSPLHSYSMSKMSYRRKGILQGADV